MGIVKEAVLFAKESIACMTCTAGNEEQLMGAIWDNTAEFVPREHDVRMVAQTCFQAMRLARQAGVELDSIKEMKDFCNQRLIEGNDSPYCPVRVRLEIKP